MVEYLEVLLREGGRLTTQALPWMSWNLFLAFVPAVLAIVLFGPGRRRSALWWMGVAAFIAFLPNAPYVLTDVIHFVEDVRRTESDVVVVFCLIPLYLTFMCAGLMAYVVSLVRLRSWMRRQGWGAWGLPVELGLHGLCAVGLYAGRFLRFNSWDLVTEADRVAFGLTDALGDRFPVAVIGTTFLVLATVGPLLRWIIDLGLEGHRRRARSTSLSSAKLATSSPATTTSKA